MVVIRDDRGPGDDGRGGGGAGGAGDGAGLIAEIGVLEENAIVLFMYTDRIFDGVWLAIPISR